MTLPTDTHEALARRTAWMIAVLVAVLVAPLVQMFTAQHRSRLFFTRALVEHGSLELDDYAGELGIDRVEIDGHVYSDKAPGQPVAAVPFYWIADRAGFADSSEIRPADYGDDGAFPAEYHVGAWWITLWFAALPAAALGALMFARTRRFFPRTALPATLALAFGSLLLPFASELYGHVLSALLAYLAWDLLDRSPGRHHHALLAGLLVGAALTVDYSNAIITVVLGVALLAERRRGDLLRLGLGVVPAVVALGWYQAILFGSPFRVSYGQKSIQHLDLPPKQTIPIFLGSRGLLFTPIVLVGLAGLVVLYRRGGRLRREALVAGGIFAGFLALQSSWVNPYGGEMPGSRYLIPALPFLAVPLAAAWSRRLGVAATSVGVVAMGLALVTLSLVPNGGANITSHLDNIRRFGFSPTVFGIWFGDVVGWVLYLLLVAGAVAVAIPVFTRWQQAATTDPTPSRAERAVAP